MIRCRRCSAGHQLGVFAIGERVVLRDGSPRADGLQPGTPGRVVLVRALAGAVHLEIHVEIASKRKRAGVVVFAPCELAPAGTGERMDGYDSLTREEFKARLKGFWRTTVRIVAPA